MLPSADEIIAAWAFLGRRFGLEGVPQPAQIEAALQLAKECAGGVEAHEPAALFYGFARHPRAVPGGWRVLGERLATAHAARLGLDLDATAEEMTALRLAVSQQRTDWPGVRAWFAAHLREMRADRDR